MAKSKEWACSKGCDLSTGKICYHLEKLLPDFTKGHMAIISGYNDDRYTMNAFQTVSWTFDPVPFLELMRNYGFTDEWDLELLEAKYCRNLSAADVAKEQNYVSKDKVKRRLRQLRELLRERGFEQEHHKWEPKP